MSNISVNGELKTDATVDSNQNINLGVLSNNSRQQAQKRTNTFEKDMQGQG